MKTHKFLKERVTVILLALCMVATMLPITAFAAAETETADFSVGSGSEALALLNANKTSGAENSTWDSVTRTLTLKGVNFTTSAATAVKLPNGAIIVLADGTMNAVTTTSNGERSVAIEGYDLTIKGGEAGTGTLTATAGNSSAQSNAASLGIDLNGDLTVEGGMVKGVGGNAESATSLAHTYGIYAGGLTVCNSAKIEATAGNAVSTTRAGSIGIQINSLYGTGNLIVTGNGSVNSTGGTATDNGAETTNITYAKSYGIDVSRDAIVSGNGRVTATSGTANTVEKLKGKADSSGLNVHGTLTLQESAAVTGSVGGDGAGGTSRTTGGSDGAGAENTGIVCDKLVQSGGTLTADASNSGKTVTGVGSAVSCGLWVWNDVTLSGGTVNATGGNAKCIHGYEATSYGVHVYGYNLTSYGDGNPVYFNVTGGSVIGTANTTNATNTSDVDSSAYSAGIYIRIEDSSAGFAVSGAGSVTGHGDTADTTVTPENGDDWDRISASYGIYIYEGDLVLRDSGAITGTAEKAREGNDASPGDSCGIAVQGDYSYGGEAVISGGTLTATGDSYGLYVDNGAEAINISGGTVTANSPSGTGLYVGNLTSTKKYGDLVVSGGTVNSAGAFDGIKAGGDVDITGGAVTATATGKSFETSVSGRGLMYGRYLTVSGGKLTAKCQPTNAGNNSYLYGILGNDRYYGNAYFKGGVTAIYGSTHAIMVGIDGKIEPSNGLAVTGSTDDSLSGGLLLLGSGKRKCSRFNQIALE